METVVKTKPAPPTYEVEFVPLERRQEDRRKHAAVGFLGLERRRKRGRREDELPPKSR